MRFIKNVNQAKLNELKSLFKKSGNSRIRSRAHAILLSTQGRPPIIFDDLKKIKTLLEKNPRSIKHLLSLLKKNYDIVVSKSTLKRLFKKMGFTWRRVKKSLRSQRDQKRFDQAKSEIEALLNHHKQGKIKLFYFDQSGFSLDPTVPYAWQKKHDGIEVPAKRGGHINGIGMITPDNELKSFLFNGKVDAELTIDCLNEFFKHKRQSQKYVVIIDNAPIHKSDDFQEKVEGWKKKNIEFYFLPPYSPKLNKIEILWRFIKHSWLSFESYENKEALWKGLTDIFKNVGRKYQISFGL